MPQAAAVWSADPDADVDFPASFLVEFFDNHGMFGLRDRPAAGARSRGGSRRYVEALDRAPGATGCASATPVAAIERLADHVEVTPRGGEPERFDEVVIATHSDQALALLADADRGRARDPRRDPLPAPTRRSCTPTLPAAAAPRAPGRAGTTTCSTSRPGRTTVTYCMNRLQPLRRRPRVLRHAQPHRADRPEHGDPHDRATTTRSTRREGVAAQAPPRRDQRRATAPTTAAPTGAGASTRTASSAALRGRRARSGTALRDRERALRGHGPPPPLRRARRRVPPPDRAGLPRPRRAAAAARRRLVARRPGLVRFRRARLPRRPGGAARRRRARPRAERTGARARRARSGCSPTCATLGHCFNPVAFYYCFDAGGELRGGRRRGHQHAVGRAPRLRPRRAARRRRAARQLDKALHVSPFMGMDQSYDWRATAPGPTLSVHIESREAGERAFDATLALRRRPLTTPHARARSPPATRRRRSRARADLRPRDRAAGCAASGRARTLAPRVPA